MNGVNKAIILGNLGRDPEIRYTADGSPVANFSVATGESWTDKNTGEKKERTEWHRCVAFGKTAEIIGQYLGRGDKIFIEGKIQTRSWQGDDGITKYTTEIVVLNMTMLGKKQTNPDQTRARNSTPPEPPRPKSEGQDQDEDDDIPF